VGIDKFTPVFKVQHLIKQHNVKVFSANFRLYAHTSQRIMEVMKNYSPDVEPYSIDEAFVQLGGFSRLDLTKYCEDMREEILQKTGVPTTIGIGATKTQAKIANRIAKKELNYELKVFNIYKADLLNDFLEMTKVEDIWGVGRQYAKLLEKHGIMNAYDLANAPDKWIKKHMTVVGLRTAWELRGIPCVEMVDELPKKKMIMFSRSFGKKLKEKEDLLETVALFTARAAERMRAQGSSARNITVYLSTSKYAERVYYDKTEMQVPVPTDNTGELIAQALKAVERSFEEGYLYYKAGVLLSGLTPAKNRQMSFLDRRDRYKLSQVTEAIDKINEKNGTDTVKYASMGTRNPWKQNQKHKSKNFVESDKLALDIKRTVGFV